MLFPTFWTGKTGRDLLAAGNKAQLLALYLLSNPAANYTGIYRLPMATMAEDLGLELSEVRDTMSAIESTGFARYDGRTKYVWIVESARLQLGELKAADNKVKYVNTEFAKLPTDCAFLSDYYAKYARALHLKPRADLPAYAVARVPEAVQSAVQQSLVEECIPAVETQEIEHIYAPEIEAVIDCTAAEALTYFEEETAGFVKQLLAARRTAGVSESGDIEVIQKLLTLSESESSFACILAVEYAMEAADYELKDFQKYANKAVSFCRRDI